MPDAPAGSGYWTAGYALWVIRLGLYLSTDYVEPDLINFLAESLQACAALLLLVGSLCFIGRSVPRLLLLTAAGTIFLWTGFTTFIVDDFLLRTIPLYGFAGAALIGAGVVMMQVRRQEGIAATQLVSASLILWGLHKLNYPWLRPVEWFAPFGFLLSEFLAMVAAVGLLLIIAGRLRNIADSAERKHEQSREHMATLNQLLQISLGRKPLNSQLGDALDTILAAPWLSLEPCGGLFLVEDGVLQLKAHRNLPDSLQSVCAKVAFGHCLCGRAAAQQEVVHAAHVDARHENSYEGMRPHGHYAVPIVSGGETLGVLILSLPDGRERDEPEVVHLRAVADALAGMIVRNRAEAAAEESRGRLVEAQRIARLGSWENDLRNDASIWSEEQYRILGYRPGEVEAHTDAFLARVHPDDIAKVRSALAAVERNSIFAVEHRVVHPDGTILHVSQVAEILRDAAGRPLRMIGTCQDVTEDKAAEQALLRAKQAAETANRAKSSFLATMSHELRTPLNAVIGFAQLLEQQRSGPIGDEKYREYIGHIRESGEHLLAMINDILDLSRVESGHSPLNESAIDLDDLVRRTVALMEAKARDGGLCLSLGLPDHLPRLRGDERAIKQVLLNLLANAVKFTPAGGDILIEVDCVGDTVELSVRDNGIGIAPADQGRVFEPFVQVDSELNRRFEGTGLGLPLVRSLIEQHGGRILLESAPGEGTCVRVRFPAERLIPAGAASRPSGRQAG
ncbi:MAG: ATP-binding protein [Kiloniellaceae bacterium]